jgi:hypothetical protein
LRLQFWPQQPHHLLKAGGRTLTAGKTFEASEEDVEELLANPEIRRVEGAKKPVVPAVATDEQKTDNEPAREPDKKLQAQTQSPGRAERSTLTDRRP